MAAILQNHYVLAVHDVKRSAAFFVDKLGFEVVNEPAGWIFVRRDSVMIMLGNWAQSIVTFQGAQAAASIEPVSLIYKLHVFFGLTLLFAAGILFLKVDSNEENFFPDRHLPVCFNKHT